MQVPAPVDYQRAQSVEDAISLLERHGPEARLLAGGHSLLPMMKLRLAQPEFLIDIGDLSDLSYIREGSDEVTIGAMTRHAELLSSPVIARLFPIVIDAEKVIADPIVRNRGTIGGSLCQGDPSEDLSAVFAALGASVVIRGASGSRVVSVDDFHAGPYSTVVGPAEILVEVKVPLIAGMGSAYEKVERRVGDWAIAAVGASITLSGSTIASARIGLTAVGVGDFRAKEAEAHLLGKEANAETFAQAGAIAAQKCNPHADQRGPEDYKRHLVAELTQRALTRAHQRVLEGESK